MSVENDQIKKLKKIVDSKVGEPDFHNFLDGIAFNLGITVSELASKLNNTKSPPDPNKSKEKLEKNINKNNGDPWPLYHQ